MEVLTSRKNPLVRQAAALKEAAARRREGLFLCEGARLCRDAALSGVEIRRCFFTRRAQERYGGYLEPVLAACREGYLVEEHVAQVLSDTKNGQELFCVCVLPRRDPREAPEGPCLVLEDVQDPGNLGTVLRTAEAFGIGEMVLAGSCCDPYSPKALRAGMGAAFRAVPRVAGDAGEAADWLRGHGYRCHGAVPDAGALPIDQVELSWGRHAVFVGNEGNGLRAQTLARMDDRVTIPMAGRAESLNASAAATVLLWEMCRKHGEENHG